MEIADCTYSDLENWVLIELWDRTTAVHPKLADRLETLINNLDNLSVREGEQLASFTPAEAKFLRSRLEEIYTAALGTPA